MVRTEVFVFQAWRFLRKICEEQRSIPSPLILSRLFNILKIVAESFLSCARLESLSFTFGAQARSIGKNHHGSRFSGNRRNGVSRLGSMVCHPARHDIEFSWIHASAGRRAVRVPDCLRRTAGRNWTRFSLAAVPTVRQRASAVSVPLDSWMLGCLSDAQFRAL